jgi:hypothetical protein
VSGYGKVLDVYHAEGLHVAQTNNDRCVSVVHIDVPDAQYQTAMQKLWGLDRVEQRK